MSGIDKSTLLWYLIKERYKKIEHAKLVVEHAKENLNAEIVDITGILIARGALTGIDKIQRVTIAPNRFLLIAVGYALKVKKVFYAAHKSYYPDCRTAVYIATILVTIFKPKVEAPFVDMVLKLGLELNELSCYRDGEKPCLKFPTCLEQYPLSDEEWKGAI
ncbi:MAG: hypothetical protein DRP01_08305 [Archaeoglobales archaeon]|nr:MAG: hypothetical protein DRP01_08305 [Archaeoglobales archaeon]